MSRETIVGVNKVGIDQHTCCEIVANHRREKGARFPLHRLDQIVIKAVLGMQTNIRFVASNVAQVEPVVGKTSDESIEAGTFDQPIGLTAKCAGISELSCAGQFHQCWVRPRIRQEMRQP